MKMPLKRSGGSVAELPDEEGACAPRFDFHSRLPEMAKHRWIRSWKSAFESWTVHTTTLPEKLACIRELRYPIQGEEEDSKRFSDIWIQFAESLAEDWFLHRDPPEVDTLTGEIAHELRTALVPIFTAERALRLRQPDEETRQLLDTVRESAERASAMVRQIRSFSRTTTGERRKLQLSQLIQETSNMILETLPGSIRFETEISPTVWPIVGDRSELLQVLLNLCVNAQDAMPHGGVLRISAENLHIDEHFAQRRHDTRVGSYVAISVSDTGVGIPQDQFDKIFEPFFSTKKSGTGLGLSVVRTIAKSHGGFVIFESHVGKGTTFRVFLPAQTRETGEVLLDSFRGRIEKIDQGVAYVKFVDRNGGASYAQVDAADLEKEGITDRNMFFCEIKARNGETAMTLSPLPKKQLTAADYAEIDKELDEALPDSLFDENKK